MKYAALSGLLAAIQYLSREAYHGAGQNHIRVAILALAIGGGMWLYHQAGRSYAPKGQTPTCPGTGKCFGANMISAITNRGILAFMIFSCTFNVDVFLKFAKRLVRQTSRKVFLIIDGHPGHRSAKTREWLEANADRSEMFFFRRIAQN